MVEDTVNAVKRVSRKVKTQTIEFANQVIDSGGIVLCLNVPLNTIFVNHIKVFCIPRPDSRGAISFSQVLSFAKGMGCSENLKTISDMYGDDLETRYMSFTVGSRGVKNQVSVEFSPKKSKLLPSIIECLKVKGLANDSHNIESSNGFHHLKLTFRNGKTTPKLYFSIGYEKIKQEPPKAYDSNTGRPLDVVKSQNSANGGGLS